MQRGKSALASFKLIRTLTADLEMMHRLAESGLRVPACATLLSRMETSPSLGGEGPVLVDQDFEDMLLVDTRVRLGRGSTTLLPLYHLPSDTKTIQKHGLKWLKTA